MMSSCNVYFRLIFCLTFNKGVPIGYGKQWKVSKSDLESLIANADSNDNCFIEVWNDSDDVIENSGT